MLRFEWNALRTGDRVVVHDPASAEMTLVAGGVVMIEVHRARKGTNRVGIRVAGDDRPSRILWPSYLAVHHDPPDVAEPCWRCEEVATPVLELLRGRELAGAPAPRRCGRCRAVFPGDTTLAMDLDTGWWACAPCHELLLGPRGARTVA